MAEATTKKTPRDLLRLVFRCKWLFLLGASTFAIVAMLVAQKVLPEEYTGESKFQRRSDVASSGSKGAGSFQEDKLTLMYDLKGRQAVALVAEELDLLKGLPNDADGLTNEGQMAKNAIINELVKNITIKWDVRTKTLDLVTVSVTNRDRHLAQRLPDALVRNYINRISERIVARLTYSKDFLQKQVAKSAARLKELQANKLKFEVEHASMMPSDPGALNQSIGTLKASIELLNTRKDAANLTLSRLRTIKPTTQPTTQPTTKTVKVPNPERARLLGQFSNLEEALRAELLNKTEKHPTIITLRDRLMQLAIRIKGTPEEITVEQQQDPAKPLEETDPALAGQIAAAESELETVNRDIQRQKKRLTRLEDLMNNFAITSQSYTGLVEKVKKEESELNTWRTRHTAIQMDLEAEVAKRRTHLNAVQAAQKQERPSSPSLMKVLALPIVGGLVFGAALVFLANLLDRSVTTVEYATQRFHVPIHGIISEIVSGPRRFSRALKNWVLLPSVMLILLIALGLSSLSAVLWLQNPKEHQKLKDAPVEFVLDAASDLVNKLPGLD